jgi:ABC-type oligopeptide transport system substrate-binding subunit
MGSIYTSQNVYYHLASYINIDYHNFSSKYFKKTAEVEICDHMQNRSRQREILSSIFLLAVLMILTGCSSSAPQTTQSTTNKQVLRFPNIGTDDLGTLDPAAGPDSNSNLAINMIFSGLVRSDKNLNVVPDQATWDVSNDNTAYTFHLKPDITFSDGTPVTAQSYVYTWTRALLPEVKSPVAPVLENVIVGATDVNKGKTTTLAGVTAVDPQTLQVKLVRPTAYFLQLLTVSLFYPLNQKVIEKYGQQNWTQNVANSGIGTGPFIVKSWQHGSQITFVPNPHYYGPRTKLSEVDMPFVNNRSTAYQSYEAGQYDFVWNLTPQDQLTAQKEAGFVRQPTLESDLLFFDNTKPPFNNSAVRQAFATAIDKQTLASAVLKGTVTPANTIVPPGEPGSQPNYAGIPFDKAKARQLFQSVYPDGKNVPPITFSYPGTQLSSEEATALQQMWQQALGIQVKLHSEPLTTYNDETSRHAVQFGFTQWGVYFPDPYEWLDLSLLSTSSNNNGKWNNPTFDATVAQAEQTSGTQRLALYAKAEQIAISDVGWLPLDHESMSAIFPAKVHGIIINGNGLYFGDWSGVSIS